MKQKKSKWGRPKTFSYRVTLYFTQGRLIVCNFVEPLPNLNGKQVCPHGFTTLIEV